MKKLLGISLALVMLIGSVPLGFSEPLKVQLEQGIETGQLQCDNPDHVLVLRTNGNVACVTERTVERGGWEIIQLNFEMNDVLEEFPVESLDNNAKTHIVLEPTSSTSHSSDNPIKPIITLDVPRNVSVGETFNVDYTIHWVNEHGKLLYPEITLEEESEISVKPYFQYPDEFEVSFDEFSYRLVYVDPRADHMLVQKFGGEIAYDTQLITGSFEMKLTKSMMYELDNLYIGFTRGVGEYFQVISHDDYVELISSSELDSEFVYYPTMIGRYSISYKYDTELNTWSVGSTIRPSDVRGLPDISHYTETSVQSSNIQTLESESPEYMPEEHWEDFAEFLRTLKEQGTEINRDWLLAENMSEEFIDDFFESYPEFLIVDTDFRLFFLPDVQAATGGNFFAYGKSLVEDYNGNQKGGNNVTICAYDVEEDNVFATHILHDGIYDACKVITATDGSFNIVGENYDEDDPTSDMDLIVGFVLENENMQVTIILGDADAATIHEVFLYGLDNDRKNISSSIINLGDLGGLDSDTTENYNKWYSVIDIPSQAFEKLDSKTSYEIPFVTLTRDQDPDTSFEYLHGSAEHDFVGNTIVYEAGTEYVDDLRDMPGTLLHEYGHHVQHRVYQDSHNSAIPTCDSHNFDEFPSQSCGWSEGWAWFFSIWMLDENTIALGQGYDDVDFENTLIYEGTIQQTSFEPSTFNGASNEGWVAATLWDIIDDSTGESTDDIDSQETILWSAFASSDAQSIFEFETAWSSFSSSSLNSIFEQNTIREDTGEEIPTDAVILKENWEVSLSSTDHYQTISDSIVVTLNTFDTLVFDYTISSEANFDDGRIYIDDVLIFETSGESVDTFTYTVTSSDSKTVKIEYYKDGSVSEGDDLFRIDTLTHYSSDETIGALIFEDNLSTDLSNWTLSGDTDWEIGQYSFDQPPFADDIVYTTDPKTDQLVK